MQCNIRATLSIPLVFGGVLFLAFWLGMHYAPSIPFKPNFLAITPLAARQEAFVRFMVPKIIYANDEVLETRAHIQGLIEEWGLHHSLPYAERSWLHEIAEVYQVNHFNIQDPLTVTALENRVDALPPSLMLAQAANESAWGTSRFAIQADNFFGQHCTVPGCGIIPFNRPESLTYEIQRFKNVQSAIEDYLYNINTHASYETLRAIRAQLRAEGEPLTGFRLAPFLIHYSILRERYAFIISGIIVEHNLIQYDAINEDLFH